MQRDPSISIVVPLFDEEDNVRLLVRAVQEALADTVEWELVLVDDGSKDRTFAEARREASENPRVHALSLARNYGQTTALQAGFDEARGAVVISMDGDLQNDPNDIPRLLARIREGYDLVVGYRESRNESLLKRKIPSWIANRLIQVITSVSIRDNGCTLKAFRTEALQGVRLYSDLHRFIPAVVAGTASARICEIPVRDHPRRFGRSKYGLSRVWKVLADLLTVTMIRWFRDRPLVMFAWGACSSAAIGLLFLAATLVAQSSFQPLKASAMVFPGATMLCFGLAGYLMLLGFISEVALRQTRMGEPPAEYRRVGPTSWKT